MSDSWNVCGETQAPMKRKGEEGEKEESRWTLAKIVDVI